MALILNLSNRALSDGKMANIYSSRTSRGTFLNRTSFLPLKKNNTTKYFISYPFFPSGIPLEPSLKSPRHVRWTEA